MCACRRVESPSAAAGLNGSPGKSERFVGRGKPDRRLSSSRTPGTVAPSLTRPGVTPSLSFCEQIWAARDTPPSGVWPRRRPLRADRTRRASSPSAPTAPLHLHPPVHRSDRPKRWRLGTPAHRIPLELRLCPNAAPSAVGHPLYAAIWSAAAAGPPTLSPARHGSEIRGWESHLRIIHLRRLDPSHKILWNFPPLAVFMYDLNVAVRHLRE